MTWALIFDDSFQRVPAANYPAVYTAGYRVMAGYVAGGSPEKWATSAEIHAWLACGPDTGFLPLFEAVGDEPATSPSTGMAHARAARTGARARGVPDASTISPAMDRNVTMVQAQGPIATYMRGWKSADTMPPLPYIEFDAGAYLHTAGLTVGTGTPAAASWDPSGRLVTPADAPDHVLWTQEHNGVPLHGGSVDIGHIRTTAPIWWSTNTQQEAIMAVEDPWIVDLGNGMQALLGMTPTVGGEGSHAGEANQLAAALAAVKAQGVANGTALTALAAKVAALPTTAVSAAPIDVNALAAVLAPAISGPIAAQVAALTAKLADFETRLEKAVAAEAAGLNAP